MKHRGLLLFTSLSFIMAWLLWGIVWIAGLSDSKLWLSLSSMLAMWMPALSVFITRKITHDLRDLRLKLTIKGHIKTYLQMWFILPLSSFLGVGLYYLIFPQDLDMTLSSLSAQMGSQAQLIPPVVLILITLLQILTFAPLLNSLLAMGEEIGWRGYLYPILRETYGSLKADILTGIIWALWHLPLLLMGYNYGLKTLGFPLTNILAMIMFCTVVHIVLRHWLDKVGSLWISAMAHGMINACAGFGLLLLSSTASPSHQLFGPSVAGLIATLPLLIFALAVLVKERKKV